MCLWQEKMEMIGTKSRETGPFIYQRIYIGKWLERQCNKLLFGGKRRSSIYGEESTGLDGERLALRPGSSHSLAGSRSHLPSEGAERTRPKCSLAKLGPFWLFFYLTVDLLLFSNLRKLF
jgi:hypothetical protein